MALSDVQSFARNSRARARQLMLRLFPKWDDDILVLLCLLGAHPTGASLLLGAGLLTSGLLLILWIHGYELTRGQRAIVGPYRFVRFPRRLALWLLALGLSFASQSFLAMLWSLGALPWFLERDESTHAMENPGVGILRYKRHVPKLLPTLFPYPLESGSTRPSFSWMRAVTKARVLRKHSYLALGFTSLSLIVLVATQPPSWLPWLLASLWFAGRVSPSLFHWLMGRQPNQESPR